jgi:hypothetical protein
MRFSENGLNRCTTYRLDEGGTHHHQNPRCTSQRLMTTKRAGTAIHDAHSAHQNVQPYEMYEFASECQGNIWVFGFKFKRPDWVSSVVSGLSGKGRGGAGA